MSNQTIKINEIESTETLKKYLIKKGENHNQFKFYSKAEYIKNIIDTHALYLSDGRNWNDQLDQENFNGKNEKTKNYGLCFSFSISENVAMWMLYSGNDGCMINFSKNVIQNILKAEKIYLGKFAENKFIEGKTLEKGQFEVNVMDIIYYGESNKGNQYYYVKRSNDTSYKMRKSVVDDLPKCKKATPWVYENECRLIISVDKKLVKDNDYPVAKIEFSEEKIEEIKERIYDSPNRENKTYKQSTLKDKMNWNLCSNCPEKEVTTNEKN